MKETTFYYGSRRPAFGGGQVALLLVIACLAWSCWICLRPRADVSQAVAAGDVSAMEISSPPLQAGQVHRLESPAVKSWWATGSYEHPIRGRVAKPGRDLHLRPWLYTTTWLPQPVVKVEADGTFDAVVYFSPLYDAPMVLALELEDRGTKTVTARVNHFFRAAEGAR